jgi:hypothetical protein
MNRRLSAKQTRAEKSIDVSRLLCSAIAFQWRPFAAARLRQHCYHETFGFGSSSPASLAAQVLLRRLRPASNVEAEGMAGAEFGQPSSKPGCHGERDGAAFARLQFQPARAIGWRSAVASPQATVRARARPPTAAEREWAPSARARPLTELRDSETRNCSVKSPRPEQGGKTGNVYRALRVAIPDRSARPAR